MNGEFGEVPEVSWKFNNVYQEDSHELNRIKLWKGSERFRSIRDALYQRDSGEFIRFRRIWQSSGGSRRIRKAWMVLRELGWFRKFKDYLEGLLDSKMIRNI